MAAIALFRLLARNLTQPRTRTYLVRIRETALGAMHPSRMTFAKQAANNTMSVMSWIIIPAKVLTRHVLQTPAQDLVLMGVGDVLHQGVMTVTSLVKV